jgi:hypothetical protein
MRWALASHDIAPAAIKAIARIAAPIPTVRFIVYPIPILPQRHCVCDIDIRADNPARWLTF